MNGETNSQMESLEQIKNRLNSQIMSVINAAITEGGIPELQGSIGAKQNAKLDHQSAGPHKSKKATSTGKFTLKQPKRYRTNGNLNHFVRDRFLESNSSESDYDSMTGTIAFYKST